MTVAATGPAAPIARDLHNRIRSSDRQANRPCEPGEASGG